MNKILIPLLLLGQFAAAQSIEKGRFMAEVGALPPFSINVKAGYGIKDNVVAGVFVERQILMTERSEAGIFGRKYMSNRRLAPYLHGGASFGRYTPWLLGFNDEPRERRGFDKPYNALKFIGGGGISFKLSNTISVGHEATLGISDYKNAYFASFLFTFNYQFP